MLVPCYILCFLHFFVSGAVRFYPMIHKEYSMQILHASADQHYSAQRSKLESRVPGVCYHVRLSANAELNGNPFLPSSESELGSQRSSISIPDIYFSGLLFLYYHSGIVYIFFYDIYWNAIINNENVIRWITFRHFQ